MDPVLQYFNDKKIPYRLYEHPAVHTVKDALALGIDMPGIGAKNLFLKNLSGTHYYLLVLPNTLRADLKIFAQIVGEKKVTFGTPEELMQYLGVTPGSVSLCGLLNDINRAVQPYVHEALTQAMLMHLHPNRNTASLELTRDSFRLFLESLPYMLHTVTEEQMPLEKI
ncbi:MAG: YbaK/EbsC family protein [Minisyncoccia bacterium]